MLEYLKKEANRTFTENGAVTCRTTLSACVDLFATIGALRNATDGEIISRFARAYAEDRRIAVKLLFFARDVRGGLGERRVFRTALRWLAENESETVIRNIENIARYGRFDDLLVLFDTACEGNVMEYIEKQLRTDIAAMERGEAVSLAGKWLPSVNTSNKETVRRAKKIARFLKMEESAYRKMLVRLRAYIKIIENNLREGDYTFEYEAQPSKALLKYRGAFIRNDNERYLEFIRGVRMGERRLNARTLAPYEVIAPCFDRCWSPGYGYMKKLTREEEAVLNATWESLPDYGDDGNALAVIDTSGSMYTAKRPVPAMVALSLGLYFAQRNKGVFRNHFIEFSSRPQLIEIKGDSFSERLRYVASFNEIADTNLEAVFDLILNAAVRNNVKAEELPERLIIISDMEFNQCVTNANATNFENAKAKFARFGYKLPGIVFWNVASRREQQPVTANEQGVVLVSGCSEKVFSMVAKGNVGDMTPYKLMMEILEGERYEKVF